MGEKYGGEPEKSTDAGRVTPVPKTDGAARKPIPLKITERGLDAWEH